jgi:predicted PurR-regulated permease PerM
VKKLNSTYFTLAVYALAVIAFSLVFLLLCINFGAISSAVSGFLSGIGSILYGILFAFLLFPAVKRFDSLFEKVFSRKKPHPHLVSGFSIGVTLLIALGVIVASTSAYPGFERRIEINGDEGYLVLKEDKIEKLMLRGVEEKQEQITVNGTAADPLAMSYALHKSQLENFVLAINGEAELLINCHEGRRALRIIEDIYRSEKG